MRCCCSFNISVPGKIKGEDDASDSQIFHKCYSFHYVLHCILSRSVSLTLRKCCTCFSFPNISCILSRSFPLSVSRLFHTLWGSSRVKQNRTKIKTKPADGRRQHIKTRFPTHDRKKCLGGDLTLTFCLSGLLYLSVLLRRVPLSRLTGKYFSVAVCDYSESRTQWRQMSYPKPIMVRRGDGILMQHEEGGRERWKKGGKDMT